MTRNRKLTEQELQRLFAGKAGSDTPVELTGFVGDARSAYLPEVNDSVRSRHLAGLMETVSLIDKGDLAAKPASKATGPELQASGLPKRRRRFMLESLFASLAAKLAVGGVAVAMAATGGAAAAGVLPDAVQTGISEAVDNIGIEIPLGETAAALEAAEEAINEIADDAGEGSDEGDSGESEGDTGDGTGEGDTGDGVDTPGPDDNFGAWVSEQAKQGGVDGQAISQAARDRNDQRRAEKQQDPADEPAGDEGAEGDDEDDPENAGKSGGAGKPVDAGKPAETGKPAGTPGGRPQG